MVEVNAVYMSFDGRKDTTIRYSFLSHIFAGFRGRNISVKDPASEHTLVYEELEAAIAQSKVALVILSEQYASSKWCLDELVKILKCRGSRNGPLVVPVFYGFTKSALKKQCLKLEKMYTKVRVAEDRFAAWRTALLEVADLPGHASSLDRSDSELVEEIVADVRQKLDSTSTIGVYSRLMKIEALFSKQPWGIRSLGIWGMGGIGKTRLAEEAFKQLLSSTDFEASCFIKDFDNAFQEKGIYGLLKEHLGKKLGLSGHFTREKLRNKRILIVLDDLNKLHGATTFLRSLDLFGPGSLIIITSRDKQLLLQCRVKEIYEVQGLNAHEALTLFSRCAFGKEVPDQNLLKLSLDLVAYASGNPLALTIYGREMKVKTLSEMKRAVRKIKNHLSHEIFDRFKRSYDALSDHEKEIFLVIVFSFRAENVDNVMQYLSSCGFFPHVGIDILVDKSLVVVSENRVQMHNLIYDMGLKIIKDQKEEIEMGYKFLEASNMQALVEENEIEETGELKATPSVLLENADIKAIIMDTYNSAFKGHIAFQHMYSLRYLKIHNSDPKKNLDFTFPEHHQSLPPELRLLHWKNYPFQSFPQDFDAQYLVEVNMPHSKLEKLWGGIKNLEVLKRITLSNSIQLVNVDELQYSSNIEKIDLKGCQRLQGFPNTGELQHLQIVDLSTFEALEVLDLSGCSKIEEIHSFPKCMKELYLAKTAVSEISSSMCHNLSELIILDMEGCVRLQNVPEGMSNMKNLASLKLNGCSKLENIHDLPSNLKELYLNGTVVRAFPSSLLDNLSKLVVLSLENCKMLKHLPMRMSNMKFLVTLKLSGCSALEKLYDFPQNLKELYLVGIAIRELPLSILDLSELATLVLKNCKRLQYLPEGIHNLNPLELLDLSDCSELKANPSSLPKAKEMRLHGMGMSVQATKNEDKREITIINQKRSLGQRWVDKLMRCGSGRAGRRFIRSI